MHTAAAAAAAAVPQLLITAIRQTFPRVAPAVLNAFICRFAPQLLLLAADLTKKGITLATHFVDEFLDNEQNTDDNSSSPPSSDDDDDDPDDRIIEELKRSSTQLPKKGNEKCTVYLRNNKNPGQAKTDFDRLSGKRDIREGKETKQLNSGQVAVLYKSTKHMPGINSLVIQRLNGKAIVKFRYPEQSD